MLGGGNGSRGQEGPMDIDRPSPSWMEQPGNEQAPSRLSPFAKVVEQHQLKKSAPKPRPRPSFNRLSLSEQSPTKPVTKPKHTSSADPKPPFWHSPYLPQLLIGYVQLAFNTTLAGIVLYLVVMAVTTVQRDVQLKVAEHLSRLAADIARCGKSYAENRCAPGLRVPAMEVQCVAWEQCMQRNPTVVGLAPIYAETLAGILNGFIEPITYKALICVLAALFGTVFISNYAFAAARSRFPVVHQIIERPVVQNESAGVPHYQNVFNRRLLLPPPSGSPEK